MELLGITRCRCPGSTNIFYPLQGEALVPKAVGVASVLKCSHVLSHLLIPHGKGSDNMSNPSVHKCSHSLSRLTAEHHN